MSDDEIHGRLDEMKRMQIPVRPQAEMGTHLARGEAWLHARWRDMRNDASALREWALRGSIGALHAAGVLDDKAKELWHRRIETCPGHETEGGREWCAYCGRMPNGGGRGTVRP